MSYLKMFPAFILLIALCGHSPNGMAEGARVSIIEPRPTGPDAPQAAPAQPATIYVNYMPVMYNRFVPGYESPFGVVLYTTINAAAGQTKMGAADAHWLTTDLNWA